MNTIKDMLGKVPTAISNDEEEVVFLFDDGSSARFYHDQDCCECVVVDDVNGDWADLIGHPLLVADERSSQEELREYDRDTWTFYTFRSVGGSVDVKWHGSSNGYYSESVDFCMSKASKCTS